MAIPPPALPNGSYRIMLNSSDLTGSLGIHLADTFQAVLSAKHDDQDLWNVSYNEDTGAYSVVHVRTQAILRRVNSTFIAAYPDNKANFSWVIERANQSIPEDPNKLKYPVRMSPLMALGMQYATAGNEFTTMSGDNYTEIVLKPFNISITAPDLQRKNVFNFVRSTGPVNPRALAI